MRGQVQRLQITESPDYTAIYVNKMRQVSTNSAQLIATGQKVYNPIYDVVWY